MLRLWNVITDQNAQITVIIIRKENREVKRFGFVHNDLHYFGELF